MRATARCRLAPSNSLRWVDEPKLIVCHYLKGWFVLDIISILPFDLASLKDPNEDPDAESSSSDLSVLKLVRIIRLLRLIKLVRLAKSSRIIGRAMEYVSLSSTSQTAVGLMMQSLLLTHWFACILMISTTFTESPRGTWLFTHGYCAPDTSGEDFGVLSAADVGEDDEGGWACVNMGYLYLKAWWWGMGLIFHNTIPMFPAAGPFSPTFVESNIYRTKFNEGEDLLLIVLKLLGIGVSTTLTPTKAPSQAPTQSPCPSPQLSCALRARSVRSPCALRAL